MARRRAGLLLAAVGGLALADRVNANFIVNGDFETPGGFNSSNSSTATAWGSTVGNFDNTGNATIGTGAGSDIFPTSWSNLSANRPDAASRQTSFAIGGSASAYFPTFSTTVGTTAEMVQSISGGPSNFQYSFDFATNSSTDTSGNGNKRTLSAVVYYGSASTNIAVRAIEDGTLKFDIQAFNSSDSTWHTITALSDLVSPSTDITSSATVYHLTIAGDFTAASRTYSVSITDPSNNTTTASGLTWFNGAAPGLNAAIVDVGFQTTNSSTGGAYLVDNLNLIAVPEPTGLAAMGAVGLLAGAMRRRRCRS